MRNLTDSLKHYNFIPQQNIYTVYNYYIKNQNFRTWKLEIFSNFHKIFEFMMIQMYTYIVLFTLLTFSRVSVSVVLQKVLSVANV